MQDVVVGVICLLVGGGGIIFRERFARAHVAGQNRLWGFRFGERERKLTKIVVVIGAGGLLVFGVLLLVGVLNFPSTS
jgi:hypothetical protein